MDIMGDKMETMGNKSKRAIENFMKAFPDYKIDTIVANIEVEAEKIHMSKQFYKSQ